MKRFLAGFLAGTLFLLLSALLFLHVGLAPVRADASLPSWPGHWLDASLHASVRRQAKLRANLVSPKESDLIAGGKLYLNDCIGCHSAPGQSASNFGATFYPPAPQLAIQGTSYNDAEAFWIAKHGIRRTGMSAQSATYSDDQLRQLTAFIFRMRSLPPGVMQAIQQKAEPSVPAPEATK